MACFVICVFELIRFLSDLARKTFNRSLVNGWLASLFVRSSSFARRDGVCLPICME